MQCDHRIYGTYNIPCRSQNVAGNEDVQNYTADWKLNQTEATMNSLALLSSNDLSDKVKGAFSYQSQQETGAGSFWGSMQTYPGGGYVANLGNINILTLTI